MNYLVLIKIAFLGLIINSCDAYEYLYDQDDSDLRWLYDNQLYGHGYGKLDFNGDFDDYLPNSYRKSVQYPTFVSYHPSTYYVDSSAQLDDQWNEPLPLYLTYETPPQIQNRPVYFKPPSTEERPVPSDGYRYPAPQTDYLPPSKRPIIFTQPPSTEKPQVHSTNGYHYPAPETQYLPPNKRPATFTQPRKPDIPKTVYLPPTSNTPKTVYLPPTSKPTSNTPKTVYLPPTRKPTTATPKTTIKTTTTLKPSTPKSLYLPPIVVPEPTVDDGYLPPPAELAPHLQPPPFSAAKPILFH